MGVPAHAGETARAASGTGHPSCSIQWETWLAEAFNEYRQISGFVQDSKAEGKEPVIGVGSLIESKEDFDAEALALEAFSLINEARAENGLHICILR